MAENCRFTRQHKMLLDPCVICLFFLKPKNFHTATSSTFWHKFFMSTFFSSFFDSALVPFSSPLKAAHSGLSCTSAPLCLLGATATTVPPKTIVLAFFFFCDHFSHRSKSQSSLAKSACKVRGQKLNMIYSFLLAVCVTLNHVLVPYRPTADVEQDGKTKHALVYLGPVCQQCLVLHD